MIFKSYLIMCDCDLHETGISDRAIIVGETYREAVKKVRENGWMVSSNGNCFCPDCCLKVAGLKKRMRGKWRKTKYFRFFEQGLSAEEYEWRFGEGKLGNEDEEEDKIDGESTSIDSEAHAGARKEESSEA